MKTQKRLSRRQNRAVPLAIILCLVLLTDPVLWAVDADNDFMEDTWETLHGLDPTDASDALSDLDQDGFANLCEFLHASDPGRSEDLPGNNITMAVPSDVGTIQYAIDVSIDGDTVLVQPGTYEEAISIIDKAIHVTGSDPHNPDTVAATVINPDNVYYDVVTIIGSQERTSTLEGLTLTGGQTGIYCQGPVAPMIARCVIAGNSSTGLYINGHSESEITVSHCRILANGSDGIVCRTSRLHLHHTIVAKNGSQWSTGVNLDSGAAGASRIVNCTIVGHGYRGIRTSNTGLDLPEITNCIVWDNGDDLTDCYASFSCIQDGDLGQGNWSADPHFVNPGANDFRVLSGSLCIDGGAPWSDYGAEPAPHGNRINMGAYGNTALATPSTDADGDGLSDNWERYYWPADDPAVHPPGEDMDADGFDNRAEYLFGYDPTTASQVSPAIIHVQVSPEQFDPTDQETLSIRYWLNTDTDTAIHIVAETDPTRVLQTLNQSALAGENALQWNGCDPNGDILERGRYAALVEINPNDAMAQAQSNTSQLWYAHRVLAVQCQPGRFFPLHNEITRITYHAVPDGDMQIKFYDPTGALFCTHLVRAADPNEMLWQGTDGDPGDPGARYLARPGSYRIEAAFKGMREKNQTSVEAYR